jgi:hypothetical protein
MAASVQLENKITGHESQGACRQDELIGGKPPRRTDWRLTASRKVTLTLILTLSDL